MLKLGLSSIIKITLKLINVLNNHCVRIATDFCIFDIMLTSILDIYVLNKIFQNNNLTTLVWEEIRKYIDFVIFYEPCLVRSEKCLVRVD